MTFAHDGLRDTLTHLAAPPYFYETLRRELATAQRNKSKLSLVKFLLSHDGQQSESQSESQYELAILSFAERIKVSIRAEDLCARLGKFEFTLIVKSTSAIALSLAERVVRSWVDEDFECKFSILAVNSNESSLEILNRLDNQELLSLTES